VSVRVTLNLHATTCFPAAAGWPKPGAGFNCDCGCRM